MEQLDDNLAAADLDLPDEAIERLDEVSRPSFGYPYSFLSNVQGRW